MAPVANTRHLFKELPGKGYPTPGKTTANDTSQKIDLDNVPLNGGILVKTLVVSIDPYQRSRLREPHIKGYVPPFKIGEPIFNFGVVRVVRSEHKDYKPGDHLYGIWDFSDYSVVADIPSSLAKKITSDFPWPVYLSALGMPGQTAYFGWKEYAKAKKGNTVFVTAGSGPVGSMVVQLAKLDGLKVIASAGSDAKCEELRSVYGADVVFNYKKEKTADVLKKEGPLDTYFDNVGGEMLDDALSAMKEHGVIIQCGTISNYNDPDPYRLKNYDLFHKRELTMHGFLWPTLIPKYLEEFYEVITPLVKEGKIKHREDVTKGLENVGDALLDVLQGRNHGKKVIVVAEE